MGVHSERYGNVSAYGKAELVGFDPGKENIVGQVAALRLIRDYPERFKTPVDEMYSIVAAEFKDFAMADGLVISKSYNSGAVEINYENTWKDETLGIPIFTIEDFYAGSDPLMGALRSMGIVPTISYDANLMLSPGLGTLEAEGNLIKENMALVAKGVRAAMEVVSSYAGILETIPA